jgi:hypothetical protein
MLETLKLQVYRFHKCSRYLRNNPSMKLLIRDLEAHCQNEHFFFIQNLSGGNNADEFRRNAV